MISSADRSLSSAHAFFSALALFLFTLLFSLQGCGGGTTGTGGTGSSQFSGRISSFNGEPVAGANVVLEETGDTAISDSEGKFDMESVLPGDSATFLVETTHSQASTALTNIPPGPHDVTVELTLDEKKNTVTIQAQSIKPPTKPRKTPTPRPKPTDVPTAEPTAVVLPTAPVSPVESATPTVTASPTDVSTPTPAETPVVLPVETATPSLPELIIFRGVVRGDPQLLAAIRLGLVGSTKRVRILSDGSFFFRASILTSQPLLEVIGSGGSAQAPLDEVTAKARKVVLKLHIAARSSGGIALSIDSVRIIE